MVSAPLVALRAVCLSVADRTAMTADAPLVGHVLGGREQGCVLGGREQGCVDGRGCVFGDPGQGCGDGGSTDLWGCVLGDREQGCDDGARSARWGCVIAPQHCFAPSVSGLHSLRHFPALFSA